MRRLRVAYVPASLGPGGAERQMLALAQGLPRDRFEVEFMILSGPGIYDELARASGARLRFLGTTPPTTAPPQVKVARRIAKVGRYLTTTRRQGYDIVDAWLYPSDVMAALMRPLTRTPIVVTGRRNVDPQDQFGRLEGSIAGLVGRWTDAVVANSTAAATHAIDGQRVDPAKVRIIRNGVELPQPPTDDERKRVRSTWGFGDADVVIGCVANYSQVKQHDRLIGAFHALVVDGLPVQLVLVGEGPMRTAMDRQLQALGLEGRVRLTGTVPDARPLYAGFDISVQASCREGLPNALLEAAAAGRAIVATNAGGSGEIVIDDVTGLLVPVDDSEAMIRALRLAVSDESLRRRLGEAARTHAMRTFGMERFISEFATLYEGLAVSKRRAYRSREAD